MGYERHNTSVLPKGSRTSIAPGQVGKTPPHTNDEPLAEPQRVRGEVNLLREAREMRDEWRRNRHSRLFGR
jgi:hypothetical protein